MRARHRQHHQLRGEAHRARGGVVSHHPHHLLIVAIGEGKPPKSHAGKHARGGKVAKRDLGGATTSPSGDTGGDPSPLTREQRRQIMEEMGPPQKMQGRKSGGGIHIKKSHQGLLHKNLGVAKGEPIPAKKLAKAEHSSDPKVRKRAVFAENAKHWHH
ncbi:MAG: hypothetical protein WAN06_14185 [Candidatus Sulfotelmatobacter sp.]